MPICASAASSPTASTHSFVSTWRTSPSTPKPSPIPVDLLTLRYVPGNGAFSARFSIAGIDQPVELNGSIELMTTAPRLINTTPAGTILTHADFEMARRLLASAERRWLRRHR